MCFRSLTLRCPIASVLDGRKLKVKPCASVATRLTQESLWALAGCGKTPIKTYVERKFACKSLSSRLPKRSKLLPWFFFPQPAREIAGQNENKLLIVNAEPHTRKLWVH